jgi:xanthine/uracil permease
MEHESAATLLSRLVGDFAALVRNEVALAKAELSESSMRAKAGVVALIGAVSTLLAGSLALVAAIILGLSKVMEPWLAALVVGVVISVVGLLLLQGARKKLVPPHVEIDRTRQAVRQDVEVLARRT